MLVEEKQKWYAVVHNDDTYDGVFYYGLKTTGIFCRPSCKSKEPKPDNVLFFNNVEEAYDFGLRPCKRCRPDLIAFDPMGETIDKAKEIIDTYFMDSETLKGKLTELGVSQNYFIQLFRSKFDTTPIEYTKIRRIEKAKELLVLQELNILEIAINCGFGSLSAFYETFKKQLNMTPKQYRKINGKNVK